MAIRVYLVPAVTSVPNVRVPMYFPSRFTTGLPELYGVERYTMDYGFEPVYLVAAYVTDEQHALLSTQTGVYTFPVNLDETVSSLSTFQAELEARNIPAHAKFIAGMRWRQAIRFIASMFLFLQAYFSETGATLFQQGVTLETAYNKLSSSAQAGLLATFGRYGWSVGNIRPTTKLRDVISSVVDLWKADPIYLGPVVI